MKNNKENDNISSQPKLIYLIFFVSIIIFVPIFGVIRNKEKFDTINSGKVDLSTALSFKGESSIFNFNRLK
jgi:hypothetical protein